MSTELDAFSMNEAPTHTAIFSQEYGGVLCSTPYHRYGAGDMVTVVIPGPCTGSLVVDGEIMHSGYVGSKIFSFVLKCEVYGFTGCQHILLVRAFEIDYGLACDYTSEHVEWIIRPSMRSVISACATLASKYWSVFIELASSGKMLMITGAQFAFFRHVGQPVPRLPDSLTELAPPSSLATALKAYGTDWPLGLRTRALYSKPMLGQCEGKRAAKWWNSLVGRDLPRDILRVIWDILFGGEKLCLGGLPFGFRDTERTYWL